MNNKTTIPNRPEQEPWPVNLFQDLRRMAKDRVALPDIPAEDELPQDWKGTLMYLMSRLNEREEQIVLLHYKDGIPYRLIGTRLGCTGSRIGQVIIHAQERMLTGDGANLLQYGVRGWFGADHPEQMQKAFETGYRKGHVEAKTKRPYDPGLYIKAFRYTHEPETTPISVLGFSTRTANCLSRARIETVAELAGKSVEELRRIRSLGKGCLKEINTKLQEIGYPPLSETVTEKGETL